MDQITLTIIIMAVTSVFFVTELIPICITTVLATISFAAFGIISFPVAFSGFSSDTMMLIVGALIVSAAMTESGATQFLGAKIIKVVGCNEKKLLVVFILMSGLLSMFMANSGVMAIMMPLMKSAEEMSGGKIKSKHLAIPVALAVLAGGSSTLAGSPSQLVPHGLLLDMGYRGFSMFELGLIGLPCLAFIVLFYSTVGYKLVLRVTERIQEPEKAVKKEMTEEIFTLPMALSFIGMGLMIAGFLSGIFTNGAVALLAASFCIVSGCITYKKAFSKISWAAAITIAGCLGIGKAITASGTAEFVAQKLYELLGPEPSIPLFLIVIGLFCNLLGNLMSHTPALTIVATVFIPLADQMGIDPTIFAMALTLFTCVGYMTPLGGASYSMTLSEGFKFTDYIKLGFIPNLVCFSIVAAVTIIRLACL